MANFPPLAVVTDMYVLLTSDRSLCEYDNFEDRFALRSEILSGDCTRMSTVELFSSVSYFCNVARGGSWGSESRQSYNMIRSCSVNNTVG